MSRTSVTHKGKIYTLAVTDDMDSCEGCIFEANDYSRCPKSKNMNGFDDLLCNTVDEDDGDVLYDQGKAYIITDVQEVEK